MDSEIILSILKLALEGKSTEPSEHPMIGKEVIIRTYSAGCWFGVLAKKDGSEVILNDSRRMWRWHAAKGISLSGCAIHGIKEDKSKIVEPVESIWLEAIEIIPCTIKAANSIRGSKHAEAE